VINVVVIDINTTRRIPITMVIVDKDDLIVDGAKLEGTSVGAVVDGL
jgi:hypothetical protein